MSGTITITMSSLAGVLTVASGNIKLGTTICGTVTNTDTIVVNGTGLITIRGDFVPGRTAEPTGLSEIELVINTDKLTFDAGAGNDTLIIVPSGADLGGDGDQDITLSGTQTLVKYMGGTGNDVLDASACTGKLTLFGGAGADHLIGGSGADSLYGDADADTLEGNNDAPETARGVDGCSGADLRHAKVPRNRVAEQPSCPPTWATTSCFTAGSHTRITRRSAHAP